MQTRPTRSALYIPGSKPRALDKARGLTCDVILFDLEDAVAPDAKIEARSTLHDALAQGGYGGRLKLVRINGLDTDWGADDARAAAQHGRATACWCPRSAVPPIWMPWPNWCRTCRFGR